MIEAKDDQVFAVEKFRKVTGAFIGDSMGTGKTVTAIARDFQLRKDYPEHEDGPTLIVTEKLGLDVWDYHLREMGVDEKQILIINPKNRSAFEAELKFLREVLFRKYTSPRYRYYIMHYDVIRWIKDSLLATPHPITWFHIIADEFHLIKNPKAQRTKLFKKIKGHYKTGCTGNPADDKPYDIWSLLNWLYPRKYRSYWNFYNAYVESEEKVRHDFYVDGHGRRRMKLTGYREMTGIKNIDQLLKEIEPFYIRRLLTDIVKDMPEKIPVRPPILVDLTPKQRKAYEQMAKKSMARIGERGSEFVMMAAANVAVHTRLRQMALATVTPVWNVEDEENITDEEWDSPEIILEKPSPKLDALMNFITTHEDEPFVIFTWFRGMADLVEEECQQQGITVVKMHGGITSHKKRTQMVEDFQAGRARIFVGTISVAGKIITLDRAHHVIFTDLSWRPNDNRQAEDRTWRRNQRNAVRIYEIQARNTIDQVRWEKIQTKEEMIDAINNPRKYA